MNLDFFDPTQATDTLSFAITSASEVAVRYSVEIVMPEKDDNGKTIDYQWLNITLDDDAAPVTSEANVFTIANIGTFSPNDGSKHEHTLTFTILDDYMGLPNVVGDIAGKVVITVRAEQID